MEKQKRILQMEAEELHDQIEHSQEIIEKLTEVEENLKQSFVKEQKEKEYLQEMLDETGQILYQIKHSEKGLAEEREILLEDLDAELQVRDRPFFDAEYRGGVNQGGGDGYQNILQDLHGRVLFCVTWKSTYFHGGKRDYSIFQHISGTKTVTETEISL